MRTAERWLFLDVDVALDRLQAIHGRLTRHPANADGCAYLQVSIDQARSQQDRLFREAATLAACLIADALIVADAIIEVTSASD